MRSLALASVSIFLAGTAFAQDPPLAVDLVATFVTGFADGGAINVQGAAPVRRTEAGIYVAAPPGGGEVGLVVEEKSRCNFAMTFVQGDQVIVTMHLNADLLKDVTFSEYGARADGLHDFDITVVGDEGTLLAETSAGVAPPGSNTSQIQTTVTKDELQAAFGTFRSAYCPGPG